MKIKDYIYFEEGEKEKLDKIMQNNHDELTQNLSIQEEFGLDLLESEKVIKIYKERIKK